MDISSIIQQELIYNNTNNNNNVSTMNDDNHINNNSQYYNRKSISKHKFFENNLLNMNTEHMYTYTPCKNKTYFGTTRKVIHSPIKSLKALEGTISSWDDSQIHFASKDNCKFLRYTLQDKRDQSSTVQNNGNILTNKRNTYHLPYTKLMSKKLASEKTINENESLPFFHKSLANIYENPINNIKLKPLMRRKSCYCQDCGGLSKLEKKTLHIISPMRPKIKSVKPKKSFKSENDKSNYYKEPEAKIKDKSKDNNNNDDDDDNDYDDGDTPNLDLLNKSSSPRRGFGYKNSKSMIFNRKKNEKLKTEMIKSKRVIEKTPLIFKKEEIGTKNMLQKEKTLHNSQFNKDNELSPIHHEDPKYTTFQCQFPVCSKIRSISTNTKTVSLAMHNKKPKIDECANIDFSLGLDEYGNNGLPTLSLKKIFNPDTIVIETNNHHHSNTLNNKIMKKILLLKKRDPKSQSVVNTPTNLHPQQQQQQPKYHDFGLKLQTKLYTKIELQGHTERVKKSNSNEVIHNIESPLNIIKKNKKEDNLMEKSVLSNISLIKKHIRELQTELKLSPKLIFKPFYHKLNKKSSSITRLKDLNSQEINFSQSVYNSTNNNNNNNTNNYINNEKSLIRLIDIKNVENNLDLRNKKILRIYNNSINHNKSGISIHTRATSHTDRIFKKTNSIDSKAQVLDCKSFKKIDDIYKYQRSISTANILFKKFFTYAQNDSPLLKQNSPLYKEKNDNN